MLSILYEDNYLLAAAKPAGLQTEKDRHGHPSMEVLVSAYLKKTYPWKKQLAAGVVHRLDRQVSGVVLFALTPMALKHLGGQFENRTVQKTYMALVENKLPEKSGELSDWLRKDLKNRKAIISHAGDKQARPCRLRYKILQESTSGTLVEVELLTGRYHQIRAQFSAAGCPVLGDKKYGSSVDAGEQTICLHSHRLAVVHPKTGAAIEFMAPLPGTGLWDPWLPFL